MSLEATLYTTLAAVCPRVFPTIAPGNTTRPYVTWQQVGGQVLNPVGNEAPDKENAFIQIDVWSDTVDEAKTLIKSIENAMRTIYARPNSAPVAGHDEDVPVHRMTQDFSVWASR